MYDSTLPREFKGIPDCSGDITWEADYDDLGWVLKNAMQVTPSTIAYDTNGFEHTFAAPTSADVPVQSFSIHRESGLTDADANNEIGELFRGCHIDKLTLTGEPGQLVQATIGVIGQNSVLEATDAPTYSTAPWIEYHETSIGSSATPDVATVPTAGVLSESPNDASSWTFEIENNLRAVGAAGLGRRAIREPINSGYRTFRLTITKDWIDREWYDAFIAEGTAGYYNIGITLLSDTLGSWGSATVGPQLEIHLPSARVLSPPPEFGGGPDIIQEELIFEGAWGTTAGICSVILSNSLSAYADASS
jgi:hypothetical protein